jgi:hypothetical protein
MMRPNNKAEHAERNGSFGSSAILIVQDPPLSVPASQRVWLFGDQNCDTRSIATGVLPDTGILKIMQP